MEKKNYHKQILESTVSEIRKSSYHPHWRWEQCGGSAGWHDPPQMDTPPVSMSWTPQPAVPAPRISKKQNHTKWNVFKVLSMAKRGRERRLANLKVDMAIGQPVGTSFIQEVNVFNQQTEERNHNLKRQNKHEHTVCGHEDKWLNPCQNAFRVLAAMWRRALPFLCYCWQSESDGRLPSGLSCSCKSFLSDPSDAVKENDNNKIQIQIITCPVLLSQGITGLCLPREWRTWRSWLCPKSSWDVTQDSCSYQLHKEMDFNY